MDTKKVSVEERISAIVSANFKYVAAGLVALAVIWGGYLIYSGVQKKREMAAQTELFYIESDLQKKQEEVMTSTPKTQVKKLKKGEKASESDPISPPEKTPETLTENYGSLVQRFEAFIKDHKGTKASLVAGITLADLYLEHKDAQRAVSVLEPLAKEVSRSDLFFGLLSSQLGVALSDAGQCEQAVKVYDKLLSAKAQEAFHSQSLLRQGACYLALNRLDEAKAAFEKVKTEHPNTYTGEMAQSYERLIDLRRNTEPSATATAGQ